MVTTTYSLPVTAPFAKKCFGGESHAFLRLTLGPSIQQKKGRSKFTLEEAKSGQR
jgi:hypothetical protein